MASCVTSVQLFRAAAVVALGLLLGVSPAAGQSRAPMAATGGDSEATAAHLTAPSHEVPTDHAEAEPLFNRTTSVLVVAGAFGALNTWTYFAWYKQRATSDHLIFNNEGWFGPDTYAGGSDKLGHFFACYFMTWLTANALAEGGWEPLPRALMGTVATQGFFTFIEFKDARHPHYGFSWGDMLFNVTGSAAALAMVNVPELDDMLDLRVDYIPSKLYFRRLKQRGAVNAGEDYTGQTYTIAYHLGSIPGVRSNPDLKWLRFLDVGFGYRAVNYLPKPEDPSTHRYQELTLLVGLNTQHVFDVLWDRYERPRGRVHGSLRFLNEMFGVPYSTAPLVKYRRDNGPAPDDGDGH
jgi:hypothetical protein